MPPPSSGPLDSLFRASTVVVGGATGALGRRLVERLLAAEARVGIPVRRQNEVEKVQASYQVARDRILVAHVAAADGEAAAGFAKGVADSLGDVEALICTQGAFAAGALVDQPIAALQRLLEANLVACHTLARALAAGMMQRGRGRMVFVGADAVKRPQSGQTAYVAAKGGLHAMVDALAEELGGHGIAVNLLAPSILDTPANRKAMPAADPTAWLTLDAAVDCLLFLASPLAACLRGSVLRAAGTNG